MASAANTDFQKVFDQIPPVAMEGKLRAEKMIKRVLVFSDMELNQASTNNWEEDYEAIHRRFRESGHEPSVPEIIFWNLRSSRAVRAGGDGADGGWHWSVGFSQNMLTMFLEVDGVVFASER